MGLLMGDWCLYPQINGRIDFPLFGVIWCCSANDAKEVSCHFHPPEHNSIPRNRNKKTQTIKKGSLVSLFSKAQFNLPSLTYFAMSATDGHTMKQFDKKLNMDLNDNILDSSSIFVVVRIYVWQGCFLRWVYLLRWGYFLSKIFLRWPPLHENTLGHRGAQF